MPSNSISTKKSMYIAIFDIGGVMAKICHTWQEAAEAAGVACHLSANKPFPLISFEPFIEYQADKISIDKYLLELGELLGVDTEQALRVHNGILVDMYPGIDTFLDQLRAQGYRLGCLSNTNAPHWQELITSERFAPIGRLEYKMASHEVRLAKPDPAIYRRFENEFTLPGESILYFDDHAPNVEAARSVGWNAHRIDPNGDPVSQISSIIGPLGVI